MDTPGTGGQQNLRNTQVDLLVSKSQNMRMRRITNLPPAVNLTDAATLADINTAISKIPKAPTTSVSQGASAGPTVQNVVTGSRSIGTVFHNTGAKPIYATVTVGFSTTSGSTVNASVVCDTSSTPTTTVAQAQVSITIAGVTDSFMIPITFIALPGYFYKVVSTGSLITWTEWS